MIYMNIKNENFTNFSKQNLNINSKNAKNNYEKF